MSNDISISDSNILSFQMSSGDHRGIIPLTAVKKEPQNQGGKDHKFARSEEAQIPSDIVEVYASLDNQEEAKPKSTSTEKPPTIILIIPHRTDFPVIKEAYGFLMLFPYLFHK